MPRLLRLQVWLLQRENYFGFDLATRNSYLSPVPQRCSEMVFAATPPYDGTLTSFYTLPADL